MFMHRAYEFRWRFGLALAYPRRLGFRGITMKFFDWHQRQTEWWLDRFGMTPYAALWFAYVKGVVTTLLVLWVLGYF